MRKRKYNNECDVDFPSLAGMCRSALSIIFLICSVIAPHQLFASGSDAFLTVTPSYQPLGVGVGKVNVTPGYSCTGVCRQPFAVGTTVTLTPTSVPGITFTGWSGCDSTVGYECSVTMATDRDVIALYDVISTGVISGRVVDELGNGMSNILVQSSPEFVGGGYGLRAPTDSNGYYSIVGLYPDDYKVGFYKRTSSNSSTLQQYFDLKPGVATSDLININGNTVTDVNAYFLIDGGVSGTVTNSNGKGIAGISVRAVNADGASIGNALTDSIGNYVLFGIPTGNYKLNFSNSSSQSVETPSYIAQSSTFVPVNAPEITKGINATLLSGGAISGAVSDSRGNPVSNISVAAYDLFGKSISSDYTDTSGRYIIKGLPTGSYRVMFNSAVRIVYGNDPKVHANSLVSTKHFSNKDEFQSADIVNVTSDGETQNVNAVLDVLGPTIIAAPNKYDFGGKIIGSTSIRSFTIRNAGTADLSIGGIFLVDSSFALVNDRCSGTTIPVTGSCTLQVAFTPVTEATHSSTISIPSNSSSNPVYQLNITGEGGAPTSTSGSSPVPYGDKIVVSPTPEVRLVFDTVTSAESDVTVVATTSPAIPVPSNFKLLSGASFDIKSTATFSGSVAVCINYTPGSISNPDNEQNLKLFHYDGVSWKDITTSVDTVSKKICGTTTSFSPFAIAEPSTETYTITVNQTANGSITGHTFSGFQPGYTQTYNIAPNPGYHVDTLTVDGSPVTAASTYTFSNIQADHSITATFAPNPTYTISAVVVGNGSVSPAGAATLLGGLTHQYLITPATGYRVDKVLDNGVNKGAVTSYSIYNIGADHTIEITFVPDTYTLTAVASGSGAITPAGITTVNGGADQTYTVVPNSGFRVASVSVDSASISLAPGDSYTFNHVGANHTIAASFVPITHTITVMQTANGSISPYTFSGFKAGANQAYSITPEPGYHVTGVEVDGNPVGAVTGYTFANIQGDHVITATFAANPTHKITATAGTNGSITSLGDTILVEGASKHYTITPAPGYRVARVLVDGISKGAITSYTFHSIAADHIIDVSFEPDTYAITATVNGSGSITPLGVTTVNAGGSQKYTVTPASGYKITSVTVNGARVVLDADSSYTFTGVKANYTINVSFAPITYTITVTQTANGSISPYTFSGFTAGMNRSYSITPKTGYRIDTLTVDGVLQTPTASYTFTNIQANHSITATFAPIM